MIFGFMVLYLLPPLRLPPLELEPRLPPLYPPPLEPRDEDEL
jgi:hypothetical protein